MLRRRRLDRSGVSEVLGTILVLLITVILFSTILVWVYSLPAPAAGSRMSFDGRLEGVYVGGSWNGAVVNVTHLGGDDLTNTSARIFLTIDGEIHTLRLRGVHFDGVSVRSYGLAGATEFWRIGETWTYRNETMPESAQVSIMIVDLAQGLVLWEKALLGASGDRAPIFVDKWVDGNPATDSRDPVREDKVFSLHAHVIDPDGDLNPGSVHAHFTFLAKPPVPLVDTGTGADKVAGDGVFSAYSPEPASKTWDGGIILLNATDLEGRERWTRLILRVTDSGSTQASAPQALGFGTDSQRYDIFEADDWEANRWQATSTREFVKGQMVVVVVATKKVPNPDLRNLFTLWDPYQDRASVYGNFPYDAPVTETSLPSSTKAFALVDFVGGFYVFEHRFGTTSADSGFDGVQLQLGHYPLEFDLITSFQPSPNNRFRASDAIHITASDGSSPDYPRVETYRDAGHTQPATTFHFTDTLYVKVVVKSTDPDFDMGDVIISDVDGRRPVWAPPGKTPVSVALMNGTTSYAFSVDLSRPNRDPWGFGLASYSLEVRNLEDADESYGRLSTQVKVEGPRWKLDITGGLRDDQTTAQFGTVTFGTLLDNTENWREYPFEVFEKTPGGGTVPRHEILAHALADLTGDGRLDLVAGTDGGHVYWYRNADGSGHDLRRQTIAQFEGESITGVGVGHVFGGNQLDVVVATSTANAGNIWWFRNDGTWTERLVDNVPARINSLRVADLNKDGFADIVVGLNSGPESVRVYLNNGNGVFGTVHVQEVPMTADVSTPGHGTLVEGTYLLTQLSNNLYQQIEERTTTIQLAANETPGTVGSVTGTFGATHAEDGTHQILTEGLGAGGKGTLGSPGHRYLFPNITATSSDTLEIHLAGLISSGSEPFQVGWSRDGTASGVTWLTGRITNQDKAELIWNVTGQTWNDETLYVHIMDTDNPRDNQLTSLSIDHLFVLQIGGNTTSSLTKVWQTGTIPSGQDSYRFVVEAFHSSNDEGDNFVFKWALNRHGPYRPLLTVNKTTDNDVAQSVVLPQSVGGQSLYILVRDGDQTPNNTTLDSLFVDFMSIRAYSVTPEFSKINVGAATRSLAIADIDRDGAQDIVVATTGTALYVHYGDGTGESWGVKDTLTAPANLRSVDVGLVTGDAYQDIVVGADDNKVYLFTNGGSRGSWTGPSTVWSLTARPDALRVGDVDGDGWDDVVVGTDKGHLVYLRNDRGTKWSQVLSLKYSDAVYSVDLGDVDRGVLIRTHPY